MSETNDVPFNRRNIDALTLQLGKFATEFTPKERELLLAIFAAAADHVDISADGYMGTFSGVQPSGGRTAADFCKELREAYMPGKAPAPIRAQVTPPHPKKGGKLPGEGRICI